MKIELAAVVAPEEDRVLLLQICLPERPGAIDGRPPSSLPQELNSLESPVPWNEDVVVGHHPDA